MKIVIFSPVVLPEEDLHTAPHGLDGIRVGPRYRIDKVDAVINSAVRVTLRTKIAVRTPAISHDRGAEFDPVTYDGLQRVGGSIPHGNKKCSVGLSFNTAKFPS